MLITEEIPDQSHLEVSRGESPDISYPITQRSQVHIVSPLQKSEVRGCILWPGFVLFDLA
jgi:hypothetical protein